MPKHKRHPGKVARTINFDADLDSRLRDRWYRAARKRMREYSYSQFINDLIRRGLEHPERMEGSVR